MPHSLRFCPYVTVGYGVAAVGEGSPRLIAFEKSGYNPSARARSSILARYDEMPSAQQ
jgi:hypothetical protein